jgi:hypothetical protein
MKIFKCFRPPERSTLHPLELYCRVSSDLRVLSKALENLSDFSGCPVLL